MYTGSVKAILRSCHYTIKDSKFPHLSSQFSFFKRKLNASVSRCDIRIAMVCITNLSLLISCYFEGGKVYFSIFYCLE